MLQALTRWGGALLELAHFKQGGEASEMINEVGNMAGLRVTGVSSPVCRMQLHSRVQHARLACLSTPHVKFVPPHCAC